MYLSRIRCNQNFGFALHEATLCSHLIPQFLVVPNNVPRYVYYGTYLKWVRHVYETQHNKYELPSRANFRKITKRMGDHQRH